MAIDAAKPGNPTDLLLGAGFGYLLTVPLLLLFAGGAVASDWPFAVAWIIAILINGPHYGATLLRVYEQRDERRKYALFAVWATLALALLFVLGLYEPLVGSLLVTLYFAWSPWHFAGQNYGIALMFLRRSGIPIAPRARSLLYASFVLSFGLTVLALNAEGSHSFQAPTRSGDYEGLMLLRLGIPTALTQMLMLACGGAYLVTLIRAVVLLRREATLRQLLPVGGLVLCQALWFAVPSALDVAGAWSARSLAFAAIWISAAHSLQYLWVTFAYAQQSGAETRLPAYLARATLAGNAAIVIPAIVFAPSLLGTGLSWEVGLSSLIFAVVNLHHFVLDGAVWKLRDGRVARLLLRTGAPATREVADTSAPRRRWWAAALWAAGAACLIVEVGELTRQQAMRWGAHDVARAVLDGLAWVGREHPLARIRFGRDLLEAGDFAGARIQFERSLRSRPTRAGWGGVGRALEGERDWRGAAEAYESGLALDPDDADLLRGAGLARLRLGEPDRAVPLLERALELGPDDPTRRALARARRDLAR